jgi:hypothetical protein
VDAARWLENVGVPGKYRYAVSRACEYQPERRFPSVRSFISAVTMNEGDLVPPVAAVKRVIESVGAANTAIS